MNLIRDLNWEEKTQEVDLLLESNSSLIVVPLDSGLEAEVTKISLNETSFVLKIWNKSSKPNIEKQYKLLRALFCQGLPVSQPFGWGFDRENNQVLLTSFDGLSVRKINKSVLTNIAKILTDIHRFPIDELDESILRKPDFINYFYPGIREHKDIETLLYQLVESGNMKQDKLIHGDFNLGNILESAGKYTIIDWTNGQLGDPRYDIAWSIVLIKIYVGQRYGAIYQSIFLSENPYTIDELELFEAIACLRWILLNRITNLPKGKETVNRVRNIVMDNKHLKDNFI